MVKKETAEKKTEALLLPFLNEKQFELVEVEYVKEGSEKVLRVLLDKAGGIRIDDCETVSRFLSKALDEADYIDEAYLLEVSSPGLLRPFKKDRDFEKALGLEVEIHFYKPQNGLKEITGVLKSFSKDSVILQDEEGNEITIGRSDMALIRKYIDFSDL